MSDLRYAIRVLLKAPGFTLAVVLVLALGIGATTAIFSVVDQALLRPLPFPDSARLFMLRELDQRKQLVVSTPDSFSSFVSQNRAFDEIGGQWGRGVTLTGVPEPQRLAAELFSASMFRVLGIRPILGRTFSSEEDRSGAEPVAVLGEKLWRETFGADPDIVGKTITLDGQGFRIVGVMPMSFHGPLLRENVRLWLPLSQRGENTNVPPYVTMFARLRGASEAEARAQMEVIAARLGRHVTIVPLQEQLVGDRRSEFLLMFGSVTLVLLIGCANVANLLLARATGRAREMVVRAAVGASRYRLIRQSLIESLMLALSGGAAGLLLAVWALHPLLAANIRIPQLQSVVLDARLLGFALAASLLTSLLSGLMPAVLAARVDLIAGLKEASGQASRSRRSNRTRGVLVVVEVALSLMLLAGAATMIQSFLRVRPAHPGFEIENRLVLTMQLRLNQYGQPAQQSDFVRRLQERLASIPGVRGVAVASTLPLSGSASLLSVIPEDTSGKPTHIWYESVTDDYFSLMGIHLRQGRSFNRKDRADAPLVAIVNDAFAKQFFGTLNPVGRTVKFQIAKDPRLFAIVGVAANVQAIPGQAPRPIVFLPFDQVPSPLLEMVLATAGPPAALLPAATSELRALDPNQPILVSRTMREVVNTLMTDLNFGTLLMASVAGVALILAAVGIYAVMAYGVAQRTQELGIRVALGARSGDVLGLIAKQGMLQLAAGLAIGSAGAWAGVHLMARTIYRVSPIGLGMFTAAAAFLALVAVAASLAPARRALRVDPLKALRYE